MSKVLQRSLEAKLAALKGPEWDSSSDEEDEAPKKKRTAKTRKVAIAKDTSNKKNFQNTASKSKPSSVIYLGHLPDDFEEREINAFLSQFGSVLNVRLSRSRRTGRARGYGFAEFVDTEVASIVAETMNGYFLLDKRLVCHVMPRDKVHPKLFFGAGRKFKVVDQSKVFSKQLEQKLSTAEGLKQISKNLIKRDKAKRKKLAALGIDYGFPELGSASNSSLNSEKEEEPTEKAQPKGKKRKVETPTTKEQNKKKTVNKVDTPEQATSEKKNMTSSTLKKKKSKKRKSLAADTNDSETKVTGLHKEQKLEEAHITPKKEKKTPKKSKAKTSIKTKSPTETVVAAKDIATPSKDSKKVSKKKSSSKKALEKSSKSDMATDDDEITEKKAPMTAVKKKKKAKKGRKSV